MTKSLYHIAVGEIDSAEEAQVSLQLVALGCYGFAFLALLCGLSKFDQGQPLAAALELPLLFVLAGIFLPRRASRCFAICLAPLSIYFSLVGFSQLLHGQMRPYMAIEAGISVVMIWVTVRSIHATFRYHQIRRSRIVWSHVVRTWCRAVAVLLPGIFTVLLLLENESVSLAIGEALLFGLIVVVTTECFVVSTRRRPWVTYPGQEPELRGSEVLGSLGVLRSGGGVLARMGRVRAPD